MLAGLTGGLCWWGVLVLLLSTVFRHIEQSPYGMVFWLMSSLLYGLVLGSLYGTFQQDGIIGRVVGASFAVLVAEELFVSGCHLLISITSAGQLRELGPTPYVVLIDHALRDEGTSYHYLAPATYSILAEPLRTDILSLWDQARLPLYVGGSWTTDAPFRETSSVLARGRDLGLVAIEMEAAALYALAIAKSYSIICFAHVTNQMAQIEGDFEKGAANGSETALQIIGQAAQIWQKCKTSP